MKLTVGMAHHMDFSGAYFTMRHIQQTQRRLKDIEFVVVDNAPNTGHGKNLAELMPAIATTCAGAKYVPMLTPGGTTQPRNRVFVEGTGDIILCCDCHVVIEPFALDRLLEFFEANPTTMDFYQGPMLNDANQIYATHFQDVWNDQMWGIWGSDKRGFAAPEIERLPVIDRVEKTRDMPPFEIPAMGLGLFCCRADAWMGFNPHFRGFGGEEFYIHKKYQQAGRKCWCLPWLRWGHRFGRPEGIGYTLSAEHKIRNYILGHLELGIPFDRLYEHFVTKGVIGQKTWDWLASDPLANVPPESGPPTTLRMQGEAVAQPNAMASERPPDMSRPQPPPDVKTLDEVLIWCAGIERDLNKHLGTLRDWAKKCEHVTEFTHRRESTVGLLTGKPKTFISYSLEHDLLNSEKGALHRLAREAVQRGEMEKFQTVIGNSLYVPEIEETDLLFVDQQHNATTLKEEMTRHWYRVRRAIAFHDTVINGAKGDDGGDGIIPVIRAWLESHPDWFVAFHTMEQYGLTVISKHPDDKPEKQIHIWAPGYGVGTELRRILELADIHATGDCQCNARVVEMDVIGPDECERRIDEFAGVLKAGADGWGWSGKMAAGWKLFLKNPWLALELTACGVSDPYPCLVRAAIKRARKLTA